MKPIICWIKDDESKRYHKESLLEGLKQLIETNKSYFEIGTSEMFFGDCVSMASV